LDDPPDLFFTSLGDEGLSEISTDEAFARAMKQEGKGPLAVFWMANPENLISLPLADIRSLAPVVGTIDCERGCVHSTNRPSL
jgi:hypothetical protein